MLLLTIAGVSVIMDLYSMKVKNNWILCFLLAGAGYCFWKSGFAGLIRFVSGALVPLAILGWMFYFRMLGPGDIKVFCALGGIMGPAKILWCIWFGMALTMTSGVREIYTDGYRLEKETTGAYTEEFEVSVDGQDAEKIDVQIPEKESEEGQAAEKTEKEESPEESRKKELREAIEKYNEIKKDPDYYYLPKDWKGQKLEWQKPGDTTGTLIAALSLFAAFVLMLKKTREEQEASAKRAEQLLMDYPSLILKFTLLIQAGMTARRAFQKMASDYMRSQPVKGHFAYEMIVLACREMDSGVAELEAYRRFGERCGQMKYKTFSTILIQNLQKGSRHMADLLEQEAMEAWDERKRKARVLGEAAATKLLIPMIMMLIVVMAIIMIPAFLSFYGQ